jgi:DNA-directed RNA polymerase specialized sigma24 family protein
VGKGKKGEREIASRSAYATVADFKRIFSEDVNSLYLLSLLLTGTPDKAEECFVEGIGESTKGNYVFKEWARSWARRTIIQSAIRLIAPIDYSPTANRSADVVPGMDKIPLVLHAEVRAILELVPLERFVFVMSVLERYSDNDCSTLLGCARRDIAPLRTRSLQQLGMFLRSKYQMESSSENPTAPENIAMITTPLIAQYFAAPEWPEGVSLG